MVTVMLFVWHAFEWVALISVLVLGAWAMSYNTRIGRIGVTQPILNTHAGAEKDMQDFRRFGDSMVFGLAAAWRGVLWLLGVCLSVTARVLAATFTVAMWPVERAVRALDARDWQLRRRRPGA